MDSVKDRAEPLLMIAAEASSCIYAFRLLEKWKEDNEVVEAFGIGNRSMESLGFNAIGRAENLAVVGFVEVIKHYSEIKSVFDKIIEEVIKKKPKVAVLLDYPGFNFRLIKKLKKISDIKIVYYISPQVWAWKKNRVKFIKRYVDHMAVVFPFEVDFYRKYGIDVSFVGHPLLDEIQMHHNEGEKNWNDERSRYGVAEEQLVLGLMPGSRKSEIEHHLRVQLETASKLQERIKNLVVFLFVAPGIEPETIKPYISKSDISVSLIQKDPIEMIPLADVILAKSGTSTLLVSLLNVPFAIMYKMSPLTVFIAKFIMKRPKFFGMPNLIVDNEIAKEFFQDEANAEDMANHLEPLLRDKEKRQQSIALLKQVEINLGKNGATDAVSRIILSILRDST